MNCTRSLYLLLFNYSEHGVCLSDGPLKSGLEWGQVQVTLRVGFFTKAFGVFRVENDAAKVACVL